MKIWKFLLAVFSTLAGVSLAAERHDYLYAGMADVSALTGDTSYARHI